MPLLILALITCSLHKMYEVRAQWEGHVSVSTYGLQNRSMTFNYTYWKSIL